MMATVKKQLPVRTVIVALGVLLVAGVLFAYVLAGYLRVPLDDAARTKLIHEGKASRFVHLSSGTMHIREAGPADGPVVLLVHGAVIGGYAFEQWVRPLTQAGYHVVVPDLLGYGYSDRPNVPYTREFYITQLVELLDGLRIKGPVHIVGASMGGVISTAFAAHTPARVKSVTLIAPAGGGRKEVVNKALLLPAFGDWVVRLFGASMAQRMMQDAYLPSPARDALMSWMREQARFRGFGEGLLNNLRNYDVQWQPGDYQALGRSGIPVMVLWGTSDTVNPFVQSSQLRAWVPQMKLIPLPDRPHAITFGDAPLLLAYILPFLNGSNQ